jgi:hypothetical protein
MPLIIEIAESIKLLGDVVKSTREIVKAVNDGSEYLKPYYPDARGDLSNLLSQMQLAIVGLADVTKVFSGFRFVVAGDSVDWEAAASDLRRLNDYLIDQRVLAASLKGSIGTLKANCEEVKRLRDKLDARTTTKTWGSMFELFGSKARMRSQELSSALSNFYADDKEMIKLLSDSLDLAEKAVIEVENALGPPGTQDPYKVPIAAQTLGIYAEIFRTTQEQLDTLAKDLSNTSTAFAS